MAAVTLNTQSLSELGTVVTAYRDDVANPCWASRYDSLPDVPGLEARYCSQHAISTRFPNPRSYGQLLLWYQPKTELGKLLLKLRRAYIAGGGQILPAEALDKDLHSERGALGNG